LTSHQHFLFIPLSVFLRQGTLRGRNVGWVSFVSGISPVLLMSFFLLSSFRAVLCCCCCVCIQLNFHSAWRTMAMDGLRLFKENSIGSRASFLLEGRP
jgi:hypothetical protein